MEEYEEFPVFPIDSILVLKSTDVLVKDVDGQRGTWQKLEFTFKVLDIQVIGDGGPVEPYESLITTKMWGSVPFKLNDGAENKLKQWVEALLGMELTVGFELDTDLLVNRSCRGITSVYEKKALDPRTGKPVKKHQIDALLPAGGQVLAGATASPSAAPAAIGSWGAPPTTPPGVDPWSDDPPF